MFAELLKEQTGLFFYFFYFLYQILLYYSRICSYRVFCVKIFIWMNPVLALKSTEIDREIYKFYFFPRNLIRNPHQTWTRTAYWFLLLFSGRKNLTWMLHWWYLQCCHVTIWPVWLKYTKNKVSVRLAPASRIKLTEVERLIMHLAF